MDEQRLDRQLRIEGWNQQALDRSSVGVIADNDISHFFNASAASLGINKIRGIIERNRTGIDTSLIARCINPGLDLQTLPSLCVNKAQYHYLDNPSILVDLNGFAMSKKMSLEWLFDNSAKGLLVLVRNGNFRMYGYEKGRENDIIREVLPQNQLPQPYQVDPILSVIGSGLILEEVKNRTMDIPFSSEVIEYSSCTTALKKEYGNKRILMIGAGALGNFVGLSLALLGVDSVEVIDPDTIEQANLNRQILFYDAVGKNKAEVLAQRMTPHVRSTKGRVAEFSKDSSVKGYDVVFDCVDNFEVREIISDVCEREGVPLISGGTSYRAGQVACFFPGLTKTIKDALGLKDLITAKKKEREERNAGCIYQPDPSVIMSNQVVGGIMVDQFRRMFSNNVQHKEINALVRYDSNDPKRIGRIIYE